MSAHEGIPNVHNDTSPKELQALLAKGKEYTVEDESVSFFVFDFRPKAVSTIDPPLETEKPEDTKLTLYLMGFPQADMQRPNDLTGKIINDSKENGRLLIVPIFNKMLKSPNAEGGTIVNALTSHLTDREGESNSLLNQLEADGINVDILINDLEIVGYSDGTREALLIADLVEDLSDILKLGNPPNRELRLISALGTFDEIDEDAPNEGKSRPKNFNKQIAWATIEEIRLRLNSEIEKFQDDPKSPYSRRKLKYIEAANEPFDKKVINETLLSFGKMLTFPQGIITVGRHIKSSSKENLGMLFDVLKRATAGTNEEAYYKVMNIPGVRTLYNISIANELVKKHFAKSERRMPACDRLKTFNVVARWPIDDLVTPDSSCGRTVLNLLTKTPTTINQHLVLTGMNLPKDKEDTLLWAIAANDYDYVGRLFKEHPKILGHILYPNAKNVDLKFIGKRGDFGGSHVVPMKSAGPFVN